MQVQQINNTAFGAKKTYLEKSKHAATKLERDYFKSLHKEAMARKSYLEYRKADFSLSDYDEGINSVKDFLSVVKIFAKMANKKLASIFYLSDAHDIFPNRFVEPDNKYIYPWRHYQLKSFSKEIPSQIKKY